MRPLTGPANHSTCAATRQAVAPSGALAAQTSFAKPSAEAGRRGRQKAQLGRDTAAVRAPPPAHHATQCAVWAARGRGSWVGIEREGDTESLGTRDVL